MNETSDPAPEPLKRRRLCLGNGVVTSPSTIDMTHPPEPSQIQHHPIRIDSPSFSGHKVSLGEYDSMNINSSTVATHSIVDYSFNNFMQATQRAVLYSKE